MVKPLGLLAIALMGGHVSPQSLPGAPCRRAGIAEEVRCLTVQVRETRNDPHSRTLGIHVVVVPARGPAPQREPLLVLQGGPGVAGTLMAAGFSRREELRDRRDMIFFDQRGTGASNLLSCAFLGRYDFLGALFPIAHVAACRKQLGRQADPGAYVNTTSADDLEAVRKALGIDAWSMYAVSFGTRLAQTYARRYPTRVRSVILDGVVPFDVGLTADLAESMERSLTFVTDRCDRDKACRARYPDTKGVLARMAARLDSAPASISVTDSTGRALSGRFGRWELAYAVRGMLYGPLAAAIPAWVHEAQRSRDYSAFARIYWQRSRWVGDSTGVALHLGVYCSEDLPFIDPVDAQRRGRGTLIGSRYYTEYRTGCEAWPMTRASAEMREPWRSSIPTLLISGERDPVTPPAYGARVAQTLSQYRHVIVPGGGHADQSTCKASVLARFLNEGIAAIRAVTCLEQLQFPAWVEP